ncbi:NAD-dependent epimerase/dehydratase family protein [Azospirillum sp. ST 5-10]|uniref:NAD-dependent epimerase/dehydratase family protein n=1 Tax=unclassified Azospirillum TaxID=2630922 RepID=UPI003F49ED68
MAAERSGPVLVTGAGGFLSAWVLARLLAAGEAVVAFDLVDDRRRLSLLVGDAAAAAVRWVTGDVTDGAAVRLAAERAEARAILHLAALTIPACRANPVRGALVDVVGHLNVFEAARVLGIRRLVYTSSAAAHPRGRLRAPANLYGVYKRADEDIAKVYFLDHGIASVGLRPNVVYGLGRDDGETAAITLAIRAAAEGRPYAMPFAGTMCFQYAGEVAEVIVRCLAAPASAPIVSDVTVREETTDDVLAAIALCDPRARILPSPHQRPKPDTVLDDAPLRGLIGDWPATPLAEGVRLTFEAYRRGGAMA